MSGSDKDQDEPRYYGAENGVVVANQDPEKLGRVKVRVEGVIEETEWFLPLGGPGGGTAQRGDYAVPPQGADVVVWFHRGDPHGNGWFAGGHWGRGEAPTPIADTAVSPADATKIAASETERWLIVRDDRAGKQVLRITDKVSGDLIEMDGARRRITVRSTGTTSIRGGAVDIQAARVTINGRVISPTGGPI